ncbi:multidrug resistance-associated protein 5 [Tanacetum coccineum]|uniref:Multidrug resistance-associated protein 5 n=1 Tax=Tanacetum coccineum TaxID=301880 RepID=A0ABQ5G514_9ASTR
MAKNGPVWGCDTIAWAVVSVENKDNWVWFMELLISDLGLPSGQGLTIIYDQHKGIIEAAKQVMPMAEHRQCARHIYANFRKKYTGVLYRNLFWQATKATYPTMFEKSRAYFTTDKACDAVENRISECFNALIVDDRRKPIINMLEDIMLLFWKVIASGQTSFEVRNGYEGFKVNERARTCTCRGHNQRSCPTKTEGTTSVEAVTGTGEDVTASVGNVCASGGMVTARGGSVTARGGKVTARGGSVTARGGKVTVRGGKVTASGGNVSASGGIVSARGGNASIRGGKVSARGGKVSARGGKVSARGGKVSARGGKVSATPSTPDSAKYCIVRSRGVAMQRLRPGVFIRSPEKVGSSYADTGSSSMNGQGPSMVGRLVAEVEGMDQVKDVSHGIRPIWIWCTPGINCMVSTMLGDSMSEIAISQSPPVESQEQEAPMQEQPVQEQPLQEQPVQRRPVQQPVQRKSERIAQILFNKPPTPGPGLDPDDAISIE